MERFSQRESVLLGYNLQRPFINSPVSSPKSQNGNSDIDFTDVFGGPPRRSFPQEIRCIFSAETTDSYASRKSDDDMNLSSNRWSGLNEKPVFGEEGANRRRYPSNDFFDDIFGGNESVALSSSPRKNEGNSLSSTPGSTVLSPARPLLTRADPWSPSLPAQFSLPARLIKGADLPTFGSSTSNHNKNKDGVLNGVSDYTYSPLSRSASQRNEVQEELSNDVSWQSSLSKELYLSSEESSNLNKPEETDEGRNLKTDSDSSEVPNNGNQFHFSVYKWASKGIPFAMPLRGGNKSRLNECKLQRCSSANGWIACEGTKRELHMATPHDLDTPSFSSHMTPDSKGFGMDHDKKDNGFLFDTSTQGGEEQCQIVEEAIPMSELANPSTHRVIVEDVPRKSILQDSIEETRPPSFPNMSSSGKAKEEISRIKQESPRTELKPLRSLLSECENEQGVDEITTKNGLKERKVKSTKKLSAVFDVSEIVEEKYEKRSTLNSEKVDKANLQVSPTSSRDNLGKNRLRGKVKEFVKLFNQDGSDKPKSDANSLRQGPRRKEISKSRKEDATTKLNEKIDLPNVNNNVPEASILVDEHLKQSEKRHPQNRANNLNSTHISSGRKGSSASTAALIPDGSEATIGDTDMSFLLITELPQDEDPVPQTSDDNEEIQVIDDKIQKWSKGKEGNIRSLLSTLQYVLWSESGWKPVPLVDIVEGNAVKRTYQKALLCLHPDKLQQKGASSHQKYTAEKVFDILQEAWTHFNTLGAL